MAPRLSQWPFGLKCGSAAARLLRLWMSVVSVLCCQVDVSATIWSLEPCSQYGFKVTSSDRVCGRHQCVNT